MRRHLARATSRTRSANALVSSQDGNPSTTINPFMVMNELERWPERTTRSSPNDRKDTQGLPRPPRRRAAGVRGHHQVRGAARHQRRMKTRSNASPPTTSRTSARTRNNEKRAEPLHRVATKRPDERLMRSIEEKIDIPESRKDDFRQRDHELHRRDGDRGQEVFI